MISACFSAHGAGTVRIIKGNAMNLMEGLAWPRPSPDWNPIKNLYNLGQVKTIRQEEKSTTMMQNLQSKMFFVC